MRTLLLGLLLLFCALPAAADEWCGRAPVQPSCPRLGVGKVCHCALKAPPPPASGTAVSEVALVTEIRLPNLPPTLSWSVAAASTPPPARNARPLTPPPR